MTVTRVRAHLSSQANGNAAGWVDLADLRSEPRQIDLLDTSDTQCVLATLGATSDLPAGNYQQIRLHLLSNNPGSEETLPSPNACDGTGGFNCVKPVGQPLQILLLNSQDRNGIKIPPGRIEGGALSLEADSPADVNLDFNACASIVEQGDGEFRLKPTLSAGEVAATVDTIRGRVVSTATGNPLPGNSTIIVLVEQEDAEGIGRVLAQSLASATDGSFRVCPMPDGDFDLAIAAIDGNGTTYNATIVFDVPAGTDLGDVGLVPESTTDKSPGVITGQVTSQGPSGPVAIDVALSALQEATRAGASSPTKVAVPLFGSSTATLSTVEDPAACPADTACASYVLNVPASNPRVGTFSEGGFSFAAPASGPVPYQVNARAFNGSQPNCSPSTKTVSQDDQGSDLTVVPGAANAVTAASLDFTGCTEVTIDSGS